MPILPPTPAYPASNRRIYRVPPTPAPEPDAAPPPRPAALAPTLHDLAEANVPTLPDSIRKHILPYDPADPLPPASTLFLPWLRTALVLYNDLLYNTKHGKSPAEIDWLERGLAVITSSYSARNLARMLDDPALERTIMMLEAKTAKPPRAIRPRLNETPRMLMLRDLLRALFLLNPLRKSTAKLYDEIAALDGEVSIATRLLPVQGTMHNARTLDVRKHRIVRDGTNSTRHAGALPAEPVFPNIEDHSFAGMTYYMTPMCDRLGHGISPLYMFHAQAWAMEQYGRLLEQHQLTHCPILPYLSVRWLTYANIGDLGAEKSTRYLSEAKRLYLRLMGKTRKVRAGVWVSATNNSRVGVLPMFSRMAAEEGCADVFGLHFVHECEPYAEVTKSHTTCGMLRHIIEEECRLHTTTFDRLKVHEYDAFNTLVEGL